MTLADRPKAVLRTSRDALSDAQSVAGDVASSLRDAFRQVRPDDFLRSVEEGPVKAARKGARAAREEGAKVVRDFDAADLGRAAADLGSSAEELAGRAGWELGKGAVQTRDAVLEAIAAVATEIARDPSAVPQAFVRLPRTVTDRIPGDVLDRLPSAIADRVPAARRRRRRRLLFRAAGVALVAAGFAAVIGIVLRRRRSERQNVQLGHPTSGGFREDVEPVPVPADEMGHPGEATAEPAMDEPVPGAAPVDETRSTTS